MTQQELTVLNLGQSLDDLMNLDPRGYGVCKILYKKSRELAGMPTSAYFATNLQKTLEKGDIVYIVVGFVLRPFKMAETDGIIGAMFLARSLYLAYGVKPVIICQDENVPAVKGLANLLGFHTFNSVEEMGDMPFSFAYYAISKDNKEATAQAKTLLASARPKCVITVEAPGANKVGEYHNAIGLNITPLEAKMDLLFKEAQSLGVPTYSIGDLGNEMGLAKLQPHLDKYIPYAAEGECNCGCGGGIIVDTAADYVLTATTSDWGCYAVCAMTAFLNEDIEIFWDGKTQADAMRRAADCGMIDMYGQTIAAIDGIGEEMNCSIVSCMKECVRYSLRLKTTCKKWFEKTLEKGFFSEKEKVNG